MIDYGHVCLLIFAQGTWKEHYKTKLLKDVKNRFLDSMDIDEIDEWAEIPQVPLFNPKFPGESDLPCELCIPLYEIFEEKRGTNEGLILFSHNILGWKGMENFLLFVLGEDKVKKIYYLELDSNSYVLGISDKIPEIIQNIKHVEINRSTFFDLFEKEKIEFSIIYEIVKY
ncbi:MAG: hypothetical protein ACFE9M_14375 [Promethearchaeota archaeon]